MQKLRNIKKLENRKIKTVDKIIKYDEWNYKKKSDTIEKNNIYNIQNNKNNKKGTETEAASKS